MEFYNHNKYIFSDKLNRVKHFQKNSTGRDFVIGDIHGCVDFLQIALHKIHFRKSVDRLFCVGDLIDRGPDSIKILNYLNEPWFHTVMGNHESLFIKYCRNMIDIEPFDNWINDEFYLLSEKKQFIQRWLKKLVELPFIITVGDDDNRFNIIHAEFPDEEISDSKIDIFDFNSSGDAIKSILYGREIIKNERALKNVHLSKTFVGHSIINKPLTIKKQIYIDGGAYLGYMYEKNRFFTINNNNLKSYFIYNSKIYNPGFFICEPLENKFYHIKYEHSVLVN